MQKLMKWMEESFAPRMNKITRNPWVAAIQDAIMGIIPLILVGSLITLLGILGIYVRWLPNFQPISDYSFGLMSLFIVFLVPYNIMKKMKKNDLRLISGLTGISLYIMMLSPTFSDNYEIMISFERLGANGMFVSLAVGLLVGWVMYQFSKFTFFKGSSALPDFIIVWFDTIIPITLLLLFGWFFTTVGGLDLYGIILSWFEPFNVIGQSFIGFVLLTFLSVFMYSFGISAWALYPIIFPIWLDGVQKNANLVAQGLNGQYINTMEVGLGWLWIGGMGATLPLVLLMLFRAKSKHLKAIGEVSIVPSIFNINEPTVFGTPIAFNPILMVPMWLNAIVIPAIVYIWLNLGFTTIPSEIMQLWYLPMGFSTFLVNNDLSGLILLAIVVAVSFVIWYPFFKVYDNQLLKKEQSEV